jgi:hypothetical protein
MCNGLYICDTVLRNGRRWLKSRCVRSNIGLYNMGTMTTQIRPPHWETTPDVTVPPLPALTVALYTDVETGETVRVPVSNSANENASKAPEQTENSVAKTVRPSRRRALA